MARTPIGPALRHIRCLAAGSGTSQPPDGELLERFVVRHDEAAFTAMVSRHGPLVWGVCRRLLRDAHDAEDAFQATFLTLARKADSIRKPGALGPWLYGVAARAAAQARTDRARRAGATTPAPVPPADPLAELTGRELSAVLDEELARLPERCRAPLVLCYLEGRTRDEAAQQLGWSLGTFKRRLERGRGLLRSGLTRRGLALSAAMLGPLLPQHADAALPPGLVGSTARAALSSAAASARAAVWAGRVMRGMSVARLRAGAALALALTVGLALAGYGVFAGRTDEPPQSPAAPAEPRPADPEPTPRADRQDDPLPAEAVARVGSPRMRHGSYVAGLAYSPDGNVLVSAGARRVRLWDTRSGKLLRQIVLPERKMPDDAVAFDGKSLLVLDGQTCRWFDPATGKEVRHRAFDFSEAQRVARFTPQGDALAVNVSPQDLVLYDLPSGRERFRWTTDQAWSGVLTFAADGKALAALEMEAKPPFARRGVRLFDTTTGKALRDLDASDTFQGLAFSPDGKKLLAHDRQKLVRVWDVATGEALHRITTPAHGFQTAAFAPDGGVLLAGGPGWDTRLIDPATGKDVRRFRAGQSGCALALTPDGKALAVGTGEGTLSQWELATGKPLGASADPLINLYHLRFARDGKALVAAADTFTVRDWKTGREMAQVRVPHEGSLWNTALSPDGSRVVGVTGEGKLTLWEAATGKEVWARPFQGSAWTACAFSPDGKRLYTGRLQGPVQAWDAAEGKELPALDTQRRQTFLLAVSPDGRRLAAGDHPQMRDGSPEIAVWDLTGGREPLRLVPKPDGSRAWALAFSPDGTRLAAAGSRGRLMEEGFLTVWDLHTGKEKVSRVGLKAAVGMCVAFSPDGRMLATGGHGRGARLWEAASGQERGAFTGHDGDVYSVAFSPDGKLLAAASADAPVLVWDVTGTHDRAPSTTPYTADEQDRVWNALAGSDAAAAFRAMRQLLARPGPAVALLRGRLKPAESVSAESVQRLLRDLDDENFATRQKAAEELEKVADQAEPLLRKAREQATSAEAKRLLDHLLEGLDGMTPERLRGIRAVEVLERLATPEARKLVEELARGAEGVRLTREATTTLRRLTPPAAPRP
jgi:RNA polymerase sigma factor (sigma-70 family)